MDYLSLYVTFLKRFLKVKRHLKVVFDSSNGTTGLVLKPLFRNHPFIEPVFINAEPNGNFPAHGPNPLDPKALADVGQAVKKHKADAGVVFDADGDRAFFVDNLGRPLAADEAALLVGKNLKGPVVLTPLSGFLLRDQLKKAGRKIVDSRVGNYFIKKIMQKKRIAFGAEISGHYYFKDFFFVDSAIFATIQFLNSLSGLKKPLSAWLGSLPMYYRIPETNFVIQNKAAMMKKIEARYKKEARRITHLDGVSMEFGPSTGSGQVQQWWFNVRPSQTEDLLRLSLEAKDEKVLEKKLKELTQLIQ